VNRFWLQVGAATAVIMLGCWLCSGTVAPYGTYDFGDCHYRMNGDHPHFSAVFAMLDGHPAVEWDYSVVLRRILHPLLAYPLMKIFGFEAGGVMFNILLHGGAMVALALAIRRFYDSRAAVLTCWLFATYPGYAYWAGLPYSYALIVPGSIACTIGLLWWHERPSLARAAIAATIVGVVGCGYDIMPFFGGALLLLAAYHRRWRDLAVSLVVLGVWAVFVARGLPAIFGFPAMNSNTQTYGNVIGAWLHFWQRTDGWGALLADVPHVLVSNFFYSQRSAGNTDPSTADFDRYVEMFLEHRGDKRWIELGMGSWEQNVRSWLKGGLPFPVLRIRYEDMIDDPQGACRSMARLVSPQSSAADIEGAVQNSSFSRMRDIERADIRAKRIGIFYKPYLQASIDSGNRFMRRGLAGDGVARLNPQQRARMRDAFGALLQEMGYADPVAA